MSTPSKPFAKAKRAVLKALRDRGIASVDIEYDGEGDSGQIGIISGFDAKKQSVCIDQPVKLALRKGDESTLYSSLREALDDFAWMILEELHGGFYNDGGGFGSFVIDVAKGTVTLDHNDRFTEVVTTVTEV